MEFVWNLVAVNGTLRGKRYKVPKEKETLIGRSRDCDIIIKDANVSRLHAKIIVTNDSVYILDQGSPNGVFVEGERVSKKTEVVSGVEITIGFQTFVVELVQSETGYIRSVKEQLIRIKELPEHDRDIIKYSSIFLESMIFTGIALTIVRMLGITEVFFGGLFLVSASLGSRFEQVLAENKHNIFVANIIPSKANFLTLTSIFMMFCGICIAYFVVAISYTEQEISASFGFVFESLNLRDHTLLTRRFSDFASILEHKALVSIFVIMLCFFYRSYGGLLTLGWNASLWVVALVCLIKRSLEHETQNFLYTSFMVFISVTPHLILDGTAYILIAVSTIWFSKGITTYFFTLSTSSATLEPSLVARQQPPEELLQRRNMSCLKTLFFGAALLVIAAFFETMYVPKMLVFVKSSIQP